MRVLVSGANGFLGRRVVDALRTGGHAVRALVRPATDVEQLGWNGEIELFRADLRGGAELEPAFEGVDALIHLAAAVDGDDATILGGTLMATERLLGAMARSETRRLLLCSSFAVYDWPRIRGTHTEEAPLVDEPEKGDSYAKAKLWQERLARRMADEHGWKLTILRPGFIWGPGNADLDCIGQRLGGWQLVFGPTRKPSLTHAENCADCFTAALSSEAAVGQVFNVVDGHGTSAWRYAGAMIRSGEVSARRVPVPYWAMRALVGTINLGSRVVFGKRGKLPNMFQREPFELRYKPLRFSTKKLSELLEWTPTLDFEECLRRTFGPSCNGEERP